MDVRSCRIADCDWDHHLVRTNIDRKYQSTKKTQGAGQRKCDVKMLKDTEIMRIYIEEIRKGITENSEQQNNLNEETFENKWKNIKKVSQRLLIRGWNIKEERREMICMMRNAR